MKPRHVIGSIIWTLVVLAIFAWVIKQASGTVPACKPPPPPLPTGTKIVKKAPRHYPTQGSGAMQLITPKAVLPSITRTNTLTWTWQTNSMNTDPRDIVFLVRTNTNLRATNWPVAAITTGRAWTNVVSRSLPVLFYAVTASNRLTRLTDGLLP